MRGMLQAQARPCSGTMPLDEGGTCLASTPPTEAASLGQLGAPLPSCAVLSAAQQAVAGCKLTGQCADEARACRPRRTAADRQQAVRSPVGAHAVAGALTSCTVLQIILNFCTHGSQDNHSGLELKQARHAFLQGNRELHGILPETFVLRVDAGRSQVHAVSMAMV